MKKSHLIISLISMLYLVSVRAADVSGVWSLRLLTSDGQSAPRATVTLKQDAEKLTGTCTIDGTDQEFTVVGQATDTTLTWRCASKGRLKLLQGHYRFDRAADDWRMDDARASAGNVQGFTKPEMS